ncbi:MAG: RNA polymerase sigma factor [Bordetella sp.]|uniref:RNA polymerase sigma factor n=1 Tax=Bordetella genomosp. 1 TaxID=1395607 RepID=UPI00211AB0A5|nr:RNA polymerase sigma factor [Bordetella genomosp. 1]MDQ8032053.1 RNA polymerase sigma factor [Bordetella sp.]
MSLLGITAPLVTPAARPRAAGCATGAGAIHCGAMDYARADDEALMKAYGTDGDMAAFDALYARHRNGLYRYLARSAGSREQADDLFQETWSRVVDARARYRPSEHARFSTWLLQIAHNLLIDSYRRHARTGTTVSDDDTLHQLRASEHEQPDQQLSQFQLRRRLQLAIEALPPDQRLTLLLKLEHDSSVDEIAVITGAPRETVRSRLRYATRRIREELGA